MIRIKSGGYTYIENGSSKAIVLEGLIPKILWRASLLEGYPKDGIPLLILLDISVKRAIISR